MESEILIISRKTVSGEQYVIFADINECNVFEVCGDVAECENMMGTYKCNCPDGFTFDTKGKQCYGMLTHGAKELSANQARLKYVALATAELNYGNLCYKI